MPAKDAKGMPAPTTRYKKRSKSPDSKIVSVAETQAATGGEFEVMQQNRQEALVEAIQ